MAPAQLPPAIQKKLNRLTRETLEQADVKNRLLTGGLEPAPSSPQDLAKLITAESRKWSRVVSQSGAKLE
jgi:tripartite-type tricarboxylate transporter receptor subunit TctC